MLDSMRRHANSWIFSLIFAVIIFVFAINFGPWAGRVGQDTSYAAEVNGRVITLSSFQASYARELRFRQMLSAGYTPEMADKEGLRAKVLDFLIDQELLAQLAENNGLVVTDDELATTIKEKVLGGQTEGLTPDAYKRWVYSTFQMTEGEFESNLKRQILAARMQDTLRTGVYVSDADLRAAFEAKNDQASISYIRIDAASLNKDAPSQQEVAAYAKQNEAAIKAYYDNNSKQFHTPQKLHLRHFFVKKSAKDTPEQRSAEKKKIDEALQKLKKDKADFATVAKASSEDSYAAKGGDMGFVSEAEMVPSVAQVAAQLPEGQVSDVIESPFGYHIIRVEGKKPEENKTLADASMDIAKTLLTREREMQAAKKYADTLLAGLKAGKKIDKLGAKVETTPLFGRSARYVPGLKPSPEVTKLVDAAFALSHDHPHATEAIAVGDSLYIIELKDRKKPDDAQFDKEKEAMRAQMMRARSQQIVDSYRDYLRKNAKIIQNKALLLSEAANS